MFLVLINIIFAWENNLAEIPVDQSYYETYTFPYLERFNYFAGYNFVPLIETIDDILKVGNVATVYKTYEINGNNYVIHLIACDRILNHCTLFINGVPTGMLYPKTDERHNSFSLNDNYELIIENIVFYYCDDQNKACDIEYRAYDIAHYSIVKLNEPTLCGNNICDSGETCSSCQSDCSCQSGYDCQNGQCIEHIECGDSVCSTDETCKEDNCCNGNNVNLNSDLNNCGNCNNICNSNKTCTDGECVLKPVLLDECFTDVDCNDSNNNTLDQCIGIPKKCENTEILKDNDTVEIKEEETQQKISRIEEKEEEKIITEENINEDISEEEDISEIKIQEEEIVEKNIIQKVIDWIVGLFS